MNNLQNNNCFLGVDMFDYKKNIFFFFTLLVLLFTMMNCSGSKEIVKEEIDKETVAGASDSLAIQTEKVEINKADGIKEIINKANFDEAFPSLSPDGNYIVYQGRKTDSDWNIYLYDVKKDSSTMFYSSAGNDESPRFSNDGTMIVFTSDKDGFDYEDGNKSRDIYLVKLNDQKNLIKITESEGDNWFPNFFDNDNKILFSSNVNDSEQRYYDEKVSLFSYNLKSKKIIEELAYIDYKNLSIFSPDQKLLAFTDKENKLKIVKLSDKENILLVSDEDSYSGSAFFSSDGTKLYYHNYKELNYSINVYDFEKDNSTVLIDDYKNSRAPVVNGNTLFFHSNKVDDDYNIYMKVMNE